MSTKLQLQGLGRLLETSGGRISVDGIAADAPATSKQCVYKSNDSAVMYRHQGNDPRFLVHDGRVPYVVDTSDGMKTNITFDFSSIPAIDRPNQQSEVELIDICFLPNDNVLGIYHFNYANFLFAGKFDFVSCRMMISSTIYFHGNPHGAFLVNESDKRVYFLRGVGYDRSSISEVQAFNNSLAFTNIIRLPFKLHYPTVRNNRLFGFRRGVREVDTTKLVEVSLTDGTKMEREIKNRDYLQINTNPFTYAWSKNTLFAVHFDQNSDLSTIVRFDLRELKWTTTNMEVKGTASELSIAGCVLTVSSNAVIGDEPEDHYYQFHMNKVDSFANLIWRSVHQYTHSNPLFTEWFVSKLPINSRFRQ